jgi:tetratricopeptide (TPR) repeat protein
MPAYAAGPATELTPAAMCFNAAATVARSGNPLPDAERVGALANCTDALAGKMILKDRIATLVNRGTIQAASNQIDASLADFDAALALNPDKADIYIDRGVALMRVARYEEAKVSFDKAVYLGGANSYIAYFNRAMAEEKVGNLTSAYQDYKQANILAPDYQPARAELSRFQKATRPADQG